MGFQAGEAEKILLASFRQFPLRKVGPPPSASSTSSGASGKVVAAKLTASSSAANTTKVIAKDDTAKKVVPTSTSEKNEVDETKPEKKDISSDKTETTKQSTPKEAHKKNDKIRFTDDGKQIPIGNGGSTFRYVWTQTLEEVTVHIPLPEGTRAKDLNVKINANSLHIRSKEGSGASSSTYIDPIEGTLFGKIRPSESTWTLETTTHSVSQTKVTTLQFILDKIHKTWWDIVLSGDTPLIDTTMVDSTRHISTYDEDTQGEIRRIMHDQRQERLGLPTSSAEMLNNLPPLPSGEKLNVEGVEYIDRETLDKASIK